MKRTLHILWHALTLRCEEADRLRCDPDAQAPRLVRWGGAVHGVICGSCRRARKQLRLLRETLRNLDQSAVDAPDLGTLSGDARARIEQKLRETV